MNRPLFIAHLVITYISALNGSLMIICLKYMTDTCITLNNQYLQILFFSFCMLILVVIESISYDFIHKRADEIEPNDVTVKDVPEFSPCVNDSCGPPTEQLLDILSESSETPVLPEVPVIEYSDLSNDDATKTKPPQRLLCYCDSSYSNRVQIGYSGFRASDGYSKFRVCPIRRPRSGSTESEVFAACLALRHTAKSHYNVMILRTDNSKVQQLFKSPKPTDYMDYPDFFDALNQCRQKEDNIDIQVKRVRGHTTRYEQRQCPIKREFAKVDRQVRQKLRQHVRRILMYYMNEANLFIGVVETTVEIHTL